MQGQVGAGDGQDQKGLGQVPGELAEAQLADHEDALDEEDHGDDRSDSWPPSLPGGKGQGDQQLAPDHRQA